MTNDVLSHLGVPEQRTRADIARMISLDPARLSPSRLARDPDLLDALRGAATVLRGGAMPTMSIYATARAGAIVEALDAGDVYSLPELGTRMKLWGMDTCDDWLVRLHGAGAASVFAAGGWCAVRRWARGVVA